MIQEYIEVDLSNRINQFDENIFYSDWCDSGHSYFICDIIDYIVVSIKGFLRSFMFELLDDQTLKEVDRLISIFFSNDNIISSYDIICEKIDILKWKIEHRNLYGMYIMHITPNYSGHVLDIKTYRTSIDKRYGLK